MNFVVMFDVLTAQLHLPSHLSSKSPLNYQISLNIIHRLNISIFQRSLVDTNGFKRGQSSWHY